MKISVLFLLLVAITLCAKLTPQGCHRHHIGKRLLNFKLVTKPGKDDYATCAGNYALINTHPLMYENVERSRVIGFN